MSRGGAFDADPSSCFSVRSIGYHCLPDHGSIGTARHFRVLFCFGLCVVRFDPIFFLQETAWYDVPSCRSIACRLADVVDLRDVEL